MIAAVCALLIAALLALPEQAAQAAREAVRVWGLDVVPSLFPYMVLCRALGMRLSSRRLPARAIAAALGMIGGSPSGAAGLSACAQREGMTRAQALPLAALCGTLSPMFLLSTLRGFTGDARLCRLLLASHLFGAFVAFALARVVCARMDTGPQAAAPLAAARDPIADSVQAILSVGGCIVFFSVLTAVARALLPGMDERAAAALHAAVEIAGGARALALAPFSAHARALLLSAACGATGASILVQNLLFLRPLGVRFLDLLLLALARAAASAAAMECLLRLFP